MESKNLKKCLDMLSVDSKVMLCLIYACKETLVPEEVLGLLYAAAKPSTGFCQSIHNVSTACGEYLEQSTSTLAPWTHDEPGEFNLRDFRAWSLSSSLRDCMDENMAGRRDIRSLFQTLLGGPERSGQHDRDSEEEAVESEKTKVVTALSALYFDQTHTDGVVRDAATWAATACTLIGSNNRIHDRRRAIEPIIWLLHQSVKDGSRLTELNFRCVRQIFLKYVYERQLDDANISILLRFDRYASAPMATLKAIHCIYSVREAPLLDVHHLGFLEVLVGHLKSDENVHSTIQRAACYALLSISNFFGEFDDEQSIAVILNTPGALAILVRSLSKDDRPRLQEAAAGILRNLAYGQELSRCEILEEDGALAALVKSLLKDNHPGLQISAAGALNNLTTYQARSRINSEIWKEPTALAHLVRSLSRDDIPNLQEQATKVLGGVSRGGEPATLRIVQVDGALAGIVRLLSRDDCPRLQVAAANALTNLSYYGKDSFQLRILEAGGLAVLVKSLLKDNNPLLQEYAAHTLMNVSYRGERRNMGISREPMALANLVRALSKGDNPNLQRTAAGALNAVATGGDSIKLRLMQEDGALAGLFRSSSEVDNPGLQETAAAALMSLGNGGKSVKEAFLKEEGALVGIMRLLSKDDHSHLQSYAAGTLANLASGGESIKIQIINQDGVLAGLVSCLFKDPINLSLQHAATWYLGDGAEPIYTPSLQTCAAQILKRLSRVKDCSMKQKIRNQDGLLTGLAGLAKGESEQFNSSLQHDAKEALKNLSYIP